MGRQIIALLTDFGMKDPYVSAMKAVIKSINPNVDIIDISHDVESFNIFQASFVLAGAAKFFPRGAVFVVVVDPGVGTSRRALVARTCADRVYVAPDNGVLTLVMDREGLCEAYEITNENFMLKPVSKTFHGRDVFAPVAAYITLGVPLSFFGRKLGASGIKRIKVFKPKYMSREVIGSLIHFDKFGNAITNIEADMVEWLDIGDQVKVIIDDKLRLSVKYVESFGYVGEGETALIKDSFGLLELVVNKGSAKDKYGLKLGSEIVVSKV